MFYYIDSIKKNRTYAAHYLFKISRLISLINSGPS